MLFRAAAKYAVKDALLFAAIDFVTKPFYFPALRARI